MTSTWRMYHLGQPAYLAWTYFGKDDARNPDPKSLLTAPLGGWPGTACFQEQGPNCFGQPSGGLPSSCCDLLYWFLLPKSLLFPGIEWPGVCAWGWGQNLLSGQGLKSFVCFIPELEERGGLITRLGPGHICPGQSIMVMVCLKFTALWIWNSLLLRGQPTGWMSWTQSLCINIPLHLRTLCSLPESIPASASSKGSINTCWINLLNVCKIGVLCVNF